MSEMGRVLLLGCAGQLGQELWRTFASSGEVTAVDRESVDLADVDQVRALVRRERPNLIVNAAAYTAVDRAESEPELAMAINGHAPGILADVPEKLLHLLRTDLAGFVHDDDRTARH